MFPEKYNMYKHKKITVTPTIEGDFCSAIEAGHKNFCYIFKYLKAYL